MDKAINLPGKNLGSHGLALGIALVAMVCSAVAYFQGRSDEKGYYSEHTVEKTLILRIPGELTLVEREISSEQGELSRIQAEIRQRLGQK